MSALTTMTPRRRLERVPTKSSTTKGTIAQLQTSPTVRRLACCMTVILTVQLLGKLARATATRRKSARPRRKSRPLLVPSTLGPGPGITLQVCIRSLPSLANHHLDVFAHQTQLSTSARSSASSVFDDPGEIMIASNFDPADTSLGADNSVSQRAWPSADLVGADNHGCSRHRCTKQWWWWNAGRVPAYACCVGCIDYAVCAESQHRACSRPCRLKSRCLTRASSGPAQPRPKKT